MSSGIDPENQTVQPGLTVYVNARYEAENISTNVCTDLNYHPSSPESLGDVSVGSEPSDSIDTYEKPPNDGIRWEYIPKERKFIRKTSLLVCILTLAPIIAYGVIENTETVLKKSSEKNRVIKTSALYTKEEYVTYPVFLNLGFGLLGIILGVIVERFCLVLEELLQFETRYKRNIGNVLRSCFSGISYKAVASIALIVTIICSLARRTMFSFANYIYVLGGIGVGPLMIHLLNLKTESEIAVSTILEKRKMYPGYTLAWSYYFVTLRKEIKHFDEIPHKELSLNRIILLLTQGNDIEDIDDLIRNDEKIEKLKTIDYKLPLYKLNLKSGEQKTFAMLYVKEPLVALKEMKDTQKVTFVNERTFEDELKRFYITLTGILEDTPHDQYCRKGLLVPITVNIGQYHQLKNGGLVRIILEKIDSVLNARGLPQLNRNRANVEYPKYIFDEESLEIEDIEG